MRFLVVGAVTWLLIACAAATGPTFRVEVDGLAAPTNYAKSYVLLTGTEDVAEDDLQFKEFATYVRGAMARRGYVEVSSPSTAEVAVFMTYGIGDPQTRRVTRTIPLYGPIEGGTSSVSLSTLGPDGLTLTTGTITTPSTYGQIGTRTQTRESITYFRYLILDAWDLNAFRSSQKAVPVWKTIVTSTGISGDLRVVFPILVAASEPFIGLNTGGRMRVELKESDPRVVAVRKP